jgi:hypothetical protein
MSRTYLNLDERLVREGLKVFGCKAKRKEILTLRGQIKWDADLEELRRSRL